MELHFPGMPGVWKLNTKMKFPAIGKPFSDYRGPNAQYAQLRKHFLPPMMQHKHPIILKRATLLASNIGLRPKPALAGGENLGNTTPRLGRVDWNYNLARRQNHYFALGEFQNQASDGMGKTVYFYSPAAHRSNGNPNCKKNYSTPQLG